RPRRNHFWSTLELQKVKESSSAFQLALTFYEARTLTDLEAALAAIPKNNPSMLIVLNDPFMFTHRKKKIVDSAADASLPAIYVFGNMLMTAVSLAMERVSRTPIAAQLLMSARLLKGPN